MAKFRNISGSNIKPILKISKTSSSIDPDTEYWTMIDVLIRKRASRDELSGDLLENIQASIIQARHFWDSARSVHDHYQSSSLLYYYSFLNLVKALLMERSRDRLPDRIHHGLKSNKNYVSGIKSHFILTDNGVFKRYYKYLLNDEPPEKIHIYKAMSNIADLGLVYGALHDKLRVIGFDGKVVNYANGKHGVLFWVKKESGLQHHYKHFPEFWKVFEKIDTHKPTDIIVRNLTGLDEVDYNDVHLYQFRDDALGTQREARVRFGRIFGKRLEWSLYSNTYSGMISLPPRAPYGDQWMNEELSSYATMFYLGDLVRYRPKYFEELLSSEHDILIKSFINTAPRRFLQATVSRMLGFAYIIEP